MKNAIKNRVKTSISYRKQLYLQALVGVATHPTKISRNANKFRYANQLHKQSKITFAPPIIGATITEQCNLRCPTCLYLLENKNRFFQAPYMTPEMLRGILEKYDSKKESEVIFLTGGEPLLNPHIGELIDICKEYDLSPKISTNGVLLKSRLAQISQLRKLEYVNVSIDSYDYDSFAKFRGGTKQQFDMILEGLKALKESSINFSTSFLLSSQNLQYVDKMIELATRINPNLVYFHNINPHGCTEYKSLTIQDNETKSALKKVFERTDYPFNIIFAPIFDTESEAFKTTKCIQPWWYLNFNTKGDVSFCCHLAHSHSIGNVHEGYDLNSPAMLKFREDMMAGRIPESCRYCQRRFFDEETAHFDSKGRKWFMPKGMERLQKVIK